MKINTIKDVNKFMEVIDSCEGVIELISNDGDRLNLKSKLCQYVALANIFGNTELQKEIEIVCHDPNDAQKLLEYMVRG